MLIFNLTVHHIWGRVLAKFQGARAVAYADDGYIKGKLSDVLQVLAELKRVLKEDAGLELNISKTAVLSKAITQQALFDVAQAFIHNSPQLTQLNGELSLDSFRPDGFVGIGVPIDTDNFVRQFVAKKCRDIIEDVEKLDAIEDIFIHFQLLRFCQATRLQYINSHIHLDNRSPRMPCALSAGNSLVGTCSLARVGGACALAQAFTLASDSLASACALAQVVLSA
jgi:hypothetical protein